MTVEHIVWDWNGTLLGAEALHDRAHFAVEDVLVVGSLAAAVAAARETLN